MNNKVGLKTINGINQQFGYIGSKEITGTSAVTPASGFEFIAIQFMEDSVVAAQASPSGSKDMVDLTAYTSISAGTIIYGRFSSITLTSGSAIGYNGVSQTVAD